MSQRTRRASEQRAARRALGMRALVAGAVVLLIAGAASFAVRTSSDGDSTGRARTAAVRVSMTEFAFDADPIVLPQGGGALLDVVNDGNVVHDLVIGDLGKGTPDLPPGGSMTLDLSDQPAGTYRVVCDLPGHTEAGMVTELVIR